MTTDAPRQKRDLRERRADRVRKSRERQQGFFAARFAAAESPYDLLGAAYTLLRGRLVQFERKAQAAARRAKGQTEKDAAAERLATTRNEIARIAAVAATELERLTDQIHTERR